MIWRRLGASHPRRRPATPPQAERSTKVAEPRRPSMRRVATAAPQKPGRAVLQPQQGQARVRIQTLTAHQTHTPHDFRHNWYQEGRAACGWAATSAMPGLHTRGFSHQYGRVLCSLVLLGADAVRRGAPAGAPRCQSPPEAPGGETPQSARPDTSLPSWLCRGQSAGAGPAAASSLPDRSSATAQYGGELQRRTAPTNAASEPLERRQDAQASTSSALARTLPAA